MERLLQGLGGVLRLAAVTLQALLCFAVTTLAGFGVFLSRIVACGHGALLRCMWVLCGCSLPKRT